MDLPLAIVFILVVSVTLWAWGKYQTSSLPPLCPWSTCEVLRRQPWRWYAQIARTHGPVLTVRNSGRPIIVINTVDAAIDLLEKRSNFACRPRWPMAELLGRQDNVGFQYYGDALRRSRRVLHGSLSSSVIVNDWSQLFDKHALKLLRRFITSPATFHDDVHESISELIVEFTYGYEPNLEHVKLAKLTMRDTGMALQPGRWMVDSFPILAYIPTFLPGAGFKRWAKTAKARFRDVTQNPYNKVKRDFEHGCAPPSFVRHSLEASKPTAEENHAIMCAASSLYSAGTDTLSGSIVSALLLLTWHPEVQDRAYAEIVSTIGQRLPTVHDKEALKYVDCIIQEVHRFHSAIPLAHHGNMKEHHYLGYRFPEKSWVMVNIWAMLHDENEYSEPELFRPERFMSGDDLPQKPRDPRTLIYGFGRRSCPGLHFANHFIFLVVARVLATLKFLPEDIDGTLQSQRLEFMPGLVPTPMPFRCSIVPRPAAKELLGVE